MSKMMVERILVVSAIASRGDNLEYGNLGNFAIVEPLFLRLRARFPSADIRTTLQFSDAFCRNHRVTCLQNSRFFTYGRDTGYETAKDLLRIALWKSIRWFARRPASRLLERSALLKEIRDADIVVDWSGDVYGDNASWTRFLEHSAKLGLAVALSKPIAVIASSPGPFSSKWRRVATRWIFKRVDLIANREPESTRILQAMGVDESIVQTTACPAFLFEPSSTEHILRILQNENLPARQDRDRPLAALVLSGWNLPLAPYNVVSRDRDELGPFARVIEHMATMMGFQVVVVSHQHARDEEGRVIPGSDDAIIQQLLGLIDPQLVDSSVAILSGLYDARESKGLLGQFDLVVSGRIHGAIAAISQCVPTVLVEYGNGPPAHKVRGFAKLVGLEDFVAVPTDAKQMIEVVERCWADREKIMGHLAKRIPQVMSEVERNFVLLEELAVRRMGGT